MKVKTLIKYTDNADMLFLKVFKNDRIVWKGMADELFSDEILDSKCRFSFYPCTSFTICKIHID